MEYPGSMLLKLKYYDIVCDITPKYASGGKNIHRIHDGETKAYIPFALYRHMLYFVTRLLTKEE